MTDTHPFQGKVLCDECHELGEGPVWDFLHGRGWWFDILGKRLWEYDPETGERRSHALPFMGSVLALIDDRRQLIASDEGLFLRDVATGTLTRHAELEPEKSGNRSNDGRVHPSGALWIGTMSKKAEPEAGAIYHIAGTTVTRIIDRIGIPNAICFSPDGAIGYYTDSKVNHLMRIPLDPATGLPVVPASVLVDGTSMRGVFDGSVCDSEGTIWNARWDGACVDRYAPDGTHLARYEMPTRRVTCPAFFGKAADRLLVTSCHEGLDAAGRAEDPLSGTTFDLGITVAGRQEPLFRL